MQVGTRESLAHIRSHRSVLRVFPPLIKKFYFKLANRRCRLSEPIGWNKYNR